MKFNPSFLTSTAGVIAALLVFARVDGSSLEYAQESLDLPPLPCCSASEMIPTKDELAKVDELERISCDISMEDFHEKYEKARNPVVLVGCDKDWPAKSRWNYPDLFARFSRDSLWKAGVGPASGAPRWHDRTPWGDFMDSFHDDNSTGYLFDQLDHENGKLLEAEYEVPLQFRADLYKELKSRKDGYPKKFGSLRWWCLGKKGTGTMPHMDPAETDAWNTVISGAKWWILYPASMPDESSVQCSRKCSIKGPTILNWYSSVGANATRALYPGNKVAQHVLQLPGETLYVPFGMVHSVLNVETSIAITANYGSPGNIVAVWKDVLLHSWDHGLHYWQTLYYKVFTKEQRRMIRESIYWPPEVGTELVKPRFQKRKH